MAKVVKHPVPKDEAEAARLMGELAELNLKLAEQQVALNQAVNDLVMKANRDAEIVSEAFGRRLKALKTYVTEHRADLTDGGKRRSIAWATGTLGWRSTPAGISVPRTSKDVAILIARILSLRKPKFLRRKWELNIEAMEASPDEAVAIEGIKRRDSSETFFVKFADGDEITQKIKLKTPSDKDLKDVA